MVRVVRVVRVAYLSVSWPESVSCDSDRESENSELFPFELTLLRFSPDVRVLNVVL